MAHLYQSDRIALPMASVRGTDESWQKSCRSPTNLLSSMSERDEEDRHLAGIRRSIRALIADTPHRYELTCTALRRINAVVLDEAANALKPVLNERVRRMPSATMEQKKELAIWLNSQLREFGLAIRCPKTGHATTLQVNPGHDRERGRFRLDRFDENHRYTSTFSSVGLPELELRPSEYGARSSLPRKSDRSR